MSRSFLALLLVFHLSLFTLNASASDNNPTFDSLLRTLDQIGKNHPDTNRKDGLPSIPVPKEKIPKKCDLDCEGAFGDLYRKFKITKNELTVGVYYDPIQGVEREMTHDEEWQRHLYKAETEIPSYNFSKFQLKHGLKESPHPPKTTRTYRPHEHNGVAIPAAQLQKYHNEGKYNIAFFVNLAPEYFCASHKYEFSFIGPRPKRCGPQQTTRAVDGITNEINKWFIETLGKGTPVVSSYDAFWSYDIQEVPGAHFHGLAAANYVKAGVLFDFISTKVIKDKKIPAAHSK